MESPSRDTATRIVETLRAAGHDAWLVGGCVRDLLMGAEPADYDVATSARPDAIKALFAHTVLVGEAFGVVIVVEDDCHYEVATFRADGEYEDGRRPSHVEFTDAAHDVARRDFTVNGLLMDPRSGEIVDHVGGRRDIRDRVIRAIGVPSERFAEDHLRMLRAVRFASSLSFEIDAATFDAIRGGVDAIARISPERVREELTKLLTRAGARRGLELLSESGLLRVVLPEVEAMHGVEQPPQFHPEGDVWEHTCRMIAMLPREPDAALAWGVLLHDVGKPPTRVEDADGVRFYGHAQRGVEMATEIMRRLRFSNDEIELVAALVGAHMRFMPVRKMRPNKLKRFLRMDRFDLHLELHRLDCASSHGKLDNYEYCVAKLEELDEEQLKPPPLLTGHDLIAMGFEPGPLFREILEAVEDAQLDGEIDSAEAARQLVLSRWRSERR